MDIVQGILRESYLLFNQMAPYLLFGFLFAGLLHVFIDTKTVSRHLGKSSFFSVVKAAIFGVPLPLCSCSVIPAAMSLKREGASRGAVLSFLISTPTTGVDSILATYSLLGPLFTIYRIAASFLMGVAAGIMANLFLKASKDEPLPELPACKLCCDEANHTHSVWHKVKGMFGYAFGDLLSDTGPTLLIGIIIGGAINSFLPQDFFHDYIGSGLVAMFMMLLIGAPMYVCATASIPIAAALMMKGLDPGAAFVFLVAGPATNIVTMAVVARNMGKGTLAIYLGSIVAGSITLGLLLDKMYVYFYKTTADVMICPEPMLPQWAVIASGAVLFALIVFNVIKKRFFVPLKG